VSVCSSQTLAPSLSVICGDVSTCALSTVPANVIVGVVSGALIVFWSLVVLSIYLFHKLRAGKPISFESNNSFPAENNSSNDIMDDVMIVNNDASSSTEYPAGTHSMEQLALAFVATPQLPPLYDTSSEGTVDGADSFGESSPDPTHYHRVDLACTSLLE
jgi:hypothetical protein